MSHMLVKIQWKSERGTQSLGGNWDCLYQITGNYNLYLQQKYKARVYIIKNV